MKDFGRKDTAQADLLTFTIQTLASYCTSLITFKLHYSEPLLKGAVLIMGISLKGTPDVLGHCAPSLNPLCQFRTLLKMIRDSNKHCATDLTL